MLVPFSSKYFVFLSHNTVMRNGSSFDKAFPVLSYFSFISSTVLHIVPYMLTWCYHYILHLPRSLFSARFWALKGTVTTATHTTVALIHHLFLYSHALHNHFSVNDTTHIQQWSHKIIIL